MFSSFEPQEDIIEAPFFRFFVSFPQNIWTIVQWSYSPSAPQLLSSSVSPSSASPSAGLAHRGRPPGLSSSLSRTTPSPTLCFHMDSAESILVTVGTTLSPTLCFHMNSAESILVTVGTTLSPTLCFHMNSAESILVIVGTTLSPTLCFHMDSAESISLLSHEGAD